VAGSETLRDILESLYAGRSQQHLANDPLSFCHQYDNSADREVVALIAAVFAYGSARVIRGSLTRIFERLGSSPTGFIDQFDPGRDKAVFTGFKHRFNDERDLCSLLWAIRQIRETFGTIEAFYRRFHTAGDGSVEQGLTGFSKAVLELDYRPTLGCQGLPDAGSFRFLFPSPAGGSACKRLCMFLRWVVRPADGIDLGLWSAVSTSQLIIPVDRHIERIGRLLGLTGRKSPDWRMALDITESLRQFDRVDPVKYDFSICHLGISAGCAGIDGSTCPACPVRTVCRKP
jgi:uncharacterized protein (TIGR02757 family)